MSAQINLLDEIIVDNFAGVVQRKNGNHGAIP